NRQASTEIRRMINGNGLGSHDTQNETSGILHYSLVIIRGVRDNVMLRLLMMKEWLPRSNATVASKRINLAWSEGTVGKSTVYR
ncbi:hypothetical protein KIN20_004002, partial [Parelaphostrongylus tenuis]